MSDWPTATLAEMEESERDILRRMDARLEWMNEAIAEGSAHLRGLRDEVEITRVSYEHQLALTRRLVEMAVTRAERSDQLVEECVDVLRSIRNQLSGGSNGEEPEDRR